MAYYQRRQASTSYPGGSNCFIPRTSIDGPLIVSFARDPKKFRVNKFVKTDEGDGDVGKVVAASMLTMPTVKKAERS